MFVLWDLVVAVVIIVVGIYHGIMAGVLVFLVCWLLNIRLGVGEKRAQLRMDADTGKQLESAIIEMGDKNDKS